MDTTMDDVGPLPEASTSNTDVDLDQANPAPAGFVLRNPNVINLDNDDGNDSDSTLLGDEFVEQVVPPVSETRRVRRQGGSHAISFRELKTYTRVGRTVQVGRTIQGQDGNVLRVISIKQDRKSGFITIESVEDNFRTLQTYSYEGRTLKLGKTVEMVDEAFLKIKAMLEDRRTGEIFLKGLRFRRNSSLEGLLERKVNEVTMINKYDPNDARDIAEQSIETINLTAVVRIRELIMTNHQFPALSFRETDSASLASSKEYMSAHCRLTCRWKLLKTSKNEGILSRLTDLEADPGCMVSQDQLRRDFRGRTTKGGASAGWLDEEIAFEREERMRSRNIDHLCFHQSNPDTNAAADRHHQRRYTFGDAFCGAGGVSRGAHGAGLRVEWGFDQDPDAIATYRLNFPHAKCEGISAYEFATSINANYKVDILHLSPPCQRFSPLHTRPFPNDEQYEATFLATETLLKKTTPRIVTLEETFGLTLSVDNLEWFNAMIQMFTKLGFSVRWKVFNLLEFGLPQPRRRLFIFASW